MKELNDEQQRAGLNRREFMAAISAAAIGFSAKGVAQTRGSGPRKVFLVPNFHPASCGWLTTFSRERVYCANSYLDHLDRVRDDPQYAFVLSEVNNIIAIMNFQPERISELKQRVAEKRVEMVNAYFLESTINLSGGEALVRLGVEGLRWYEQVFGLRPKYSWNIDVCGTHDQMPQIASGLGLEALIYTRRNPTGKTIYWSVAPDGSKILTLSPGGYSEASPIFSSNTPLTVEQLSKLVQYFDSKESITPEGAPILVLAGGDDYALAPIVKSYPSDFLEQWAKAGSGREIEFTTFSQYLDAVQPEIASGKIPVPTLYGGTAYDFDAFWIECAEVKTRYRRNEHTLQAAEMLATIASLQVQENTFEYPARALHDSWILMCLNMDRNTLWGSAGGMVFVSEQSWDVQDRFEWVKMTTGQTLDSAGKSLLPAGEEIGLFNPLNWKRKDPVELQLPAGVSPDGLACESLPGGSVLCQVEMPSISACGLKLARRSAATPEVVELPEVIETSYYLARFDRSTGALSSLKSKKTKRELLGAGANVIVAEQPAKVRDNAPADFMPPRPERTRVASSSDQPSTMRAAKGPVAWTIEASGTFYGGRAIRRLVRLYHESPRIDFETELNDIPKDTVVVAEFPLAMDILQVRRGIPFGFSHGAWAKPDPQLHGWTKGIVPAVRWVDYALSGGGGFAILDRGLSGRELNGRTPILYLINAQDEYHGYPNAWLSGKGRHLLPYSVLGYEGSWSGAHIPQMAWEYNREPVVIPGRAAMQARSFVETSDNVIVEAMRREGDHIELRMVESLGMPGTATIKVLFPHRKAMLTDLVGGKRSDLPQAATYELPVRAQEIVTMHLETSSSVPIPPPTTSWDSFVPAGKLAALHAYDPNLKGHPPFGNGPTF
jgi:alpha-mannosidase